MTSFLNKLNVYLGGGESILERVFKTPPRKPDARMFFIGGAGLISLIRGVNNLWGNPPVGALFDKLGNFFTVFWSIMWVLIGLFTVIVAMLGHKVPALDLAVAYLLLFLWWLWAFIYFVSALFLRGDFLQDIIATFILSITGTVLTAGVILSIRKTQLLTLNEAMRAQLEGAKADLETLALQCKQLREQLESQDGH